VEARAAGADGGWVAHRGRERREDGRAGVRADRPCHPEDVFSRIEGCLPAERLPGSKTRAPDRPAGRESVWAAFLSGRGLPLMVEDGRLLILPCHRQIQTRQALVISLVSLTLLVFYCLGSVFLLN